MDHRALLVPAVLLVLVAVGVERAVSHRQGRCRSTAVMLGNGWMALFEQAAGLLVYPGLVGVYASLAAWAPFTLPANAVWVWMLAFVGVDLAFYAYHRFCHGTSLGWSLHAVHHQSPQLDFSAALRNSPLGGAVQFLFHIPLALLGLPVGPWLLAKTINPVWQLLMHTETVGKIPWVEGWLNTPSAHRVHHGTQPLYRDSNLGGMLVVWDRLFGSYTPESETPSYGTVPSLGSLDPIRAQAEPLGDLVRAVATEGAGVLLRHPRTQPTRAEVRLPRPASMPIALGAVLFVSGVACLVGLALGWIPLVVGVPALLIGGSVTARVLRDHPGSGGP